MCTTPTTNTFTTRANCVAIYARTHSMSHSSSGQCSRFLSNKEIKLNKGKKTHTAPGDSIRRSAWAYEIGIRKWNGTPKREEEKRKKNFEVKTHQMNYKYVFQMQKKWFTCGLHHFSFSAMRFGFGWIRQGVMLSMHHISAYEKCFFLLSHPPFFFPQKTLGFLMKFIFSKGWIEEKPIKRSPVRLQITLTKPKVKEKRWFRLLNAISTKRLFSRTPSRCHE